MNKDYKFNETVNSNKENSILENKTNELEYFIYLIFNNNIRLKWKTFGKNNIIGFDIERQSGEIWEKTGFIPSYSGQIYEYTDYNLRPGNYKYRIKQTDNKGNYRYFHLEEEIKIKNPRKYILSQNFSNPFDKATKIIIELPYEEYITLTISDTSGRDVANIYRGFKRAGTHEIEFRNENLPSGIYYYKLVAGSFSDRKIMTIIS